MLNERIEKLESNQIKFGANEPIVCVYLVRQYAQTIQWRFVLKLNWICIRHNKMVLWRLSHADKHTHPNGRGME